MLYLLGAFPYLLTEQAHRASSLSDPPGQFWGIFAFTMAISALAFAAQIMQVSRWPARRWTDGRSVNP